MTAVAEKIPAAVTTIPVDVAQLSDLRDRVDAELAVRSLSQFVKMMWPTVEGSRYVHGYHIDAICEHLMAVSSGQIKKLLITIPPRFMKSLLTAVFWPAWDWLKNPERRFLFASYAQSLSLRDSRRCRMVIQSERYEKLLQSHQPDLVLVGDQNTKIRFDNNFNGYRIATSVGGALTGEGGNVVCVDDAHNLIEGESEAVREGVITWWSEAMSTRRDDFKNSAYVIIGQRVHEHDLIGHILATESGWDHLCLPMRYEGNSRVASTLGYKDPRKVANELLWPTRCDEADCRELEERLGQYATACQLQQRPAPREGGMFRTANMAIVKAVNPNMVVDTVRYWDKAGTQGGGAYTAGVRMRRLKKVQGMTFEYVIDDVVRGQWTAGVREAYIKMTAQTDNHKSGHIIKTWVEQEPGSGGKESAENTIRMLTGYRVFKDPVGASEGNKVARAEPLSAQVEIGNVAVLEAPWTRDLLDEMKLFPNGRYKDQVDAVSGAFNKLCVPAKRAGAWGSR